jgi:glutamine amidotransferase
LEESEEFGAHRGLGILPGRVVAFDNPRDGNRRLKVPQVGWNRIHRPQGTSSDFWQDTLLDGRSDGEFMYFVHSFILQPDDSSVILSTSCYGDVTFCSSLVWRSITAFQFHPERSGFSGLQVYRNLALQVQQAQKEINPR